MNKSYQKEINSVKNRIKKFKSKSGAHQLLAMNLKSLEDQNLNFYQSSYLQIILDKENLSINIKTLTNNVFEFMLIKDFFLQVEKNFYRFVRSYSNRNQLKKRFDEITQGNELIKDIFLDNDLQPNKTFNHIMIYETLFPLISADIYRKFRSLHVYDRKAHSKITLKNRFSQNQNKILLSKAYLNGRQSFSTLIHQAMLNSMINPRHKHSVLNFENFKTASGFFREKNQMIRNEHYDDEFLSQLQLTKLPLESEFVSTILQKIQQVWKVDGSKIELFKEKMKQIYIFNTKLLENYFEIKFNSLLHLKNAIKDKKILLRNLQGKILGDFYFSGELERNNYKDILEKIQCFDYQKVDFNFANNQSLREYDSKTPVLYYYMKKQSNLAKQLQGN